VLQIHNNLAKHGIYPSDITKVLMSHLHKDHAGGIVMKDLFRGDYQLSFPHATYYIQERELNYALSKESASFDTSALMPLVENEQVVLLKDDQGSISDRIHFELSGGHSPFHQVFYFHDNSGLVLYGGDEAPQLQQMRTRFVAKYDKDGKKAMMLRQQWWERGSIEKWTFLFYHDIKTPTFKAG
jgi:glyoxylase-like metal-dependent hydrolase (beta-lactamase superfamily II)